MHPAPSVIIFTAFSGLGFGLLAWIGLGYPDMSALTGPARFSVYFVAYALAVGGLLSSVFHLANPRNAIYAFSQWQTSWLSREGILAVVTLLAFAPMAVAQIFFGSTALDWIGPLGTLLALVTVFSTSMIYTQLKAIPRWNMALTPVLFLAYSVAGGALLSMQARVAGGLILVLVALQWVGWIMGDARLSDTGSTKGTATGLGAIGKVSTFESAHTARNYVVDEMVHVVGRKHAAKLRVISTLFLGVIPVVILLVLPVTVPLVLLALASHLVGLVAARWLFFAEAEHVVSLYYQRD